MTVIAWDKKVLAADGLAIFGELKRKATKMIHDPIHCRAYACSGYQPHLIPLVRWHSEGADPDKYPDFQKGDNPSTLVVASDAGAEFYNYYPYPTYIEDEFAAWGSGADAAQAVMQYQKDRGCDPSAFIAVEVACNVCYGCGDPVSYVNLDGSGQRNVWNIDNFLK